MARGMRRTEPLFAPAEVRLGSTPAVRWIADERPRRVVSRQSAYRVGFLVSRHSAQPRQLHAHARSSRRGGKLVTQHHEGLAGEDRRQGRRACPLRRLPYGRGGGAPRPVRQNPGTDRWPPTTSAGAMLEGCDARVSRQTGGIPPPWRIMRRNRRAGIGAATATVVHGRTLAPPFLGRSHMWVEVMRPIFAA